MNTALTAAFLLSAPMAALACSDTRVELRGDFGTAQFRVEVADDPQERATGLMHRESMPQFSGMLFVYQTEDVVSFWMQNTLIPLDMIFMDATGTVVKVHENAIPLDRTAIPSDFPTQYVLEINGGLASQLGIGSGTELRHPAIDQEIAAWACD